MNLFSRIFKTYRDKDGWIKVRTPDVEHLDSDIYSDYKQFSDLCEYASSKNFGAQIKEASHGLACVIGYRNLYQERINETGDEDIEALAKMLIVCRFSNSIYSTMRLACMGLVLDAIACFKTAFEALQYGRLISLKPEFAASFMDSEKPLRPVEVRKALQSLGHDVERARKRYSMLSTFSHVGGTGEVLTLEPIEGNVAFKIGGYVDPELQRQIIVECHKACGEFLAFSTGIRHENVERYHATIKGWIAEGLSADEIMQRIPTLIEEMK